MSVCLCERGGRESDECPHACEQKERQPGEVRNRVSFKQHAEMICLCFYSPVKDNVKQCFFATNHHKSPSCMSLTKQKTFKYVFFCNEGQKNQTISKLQRQTLIFGKCGVTRGSGGGVYTPPDDSIRTEH